MRQALSLSKNFNRFKGLCPLAGGGYAVPSKHSPSPRGGVGVGVIFGVFTPEKDFFDTQKPLVRLDRGLISIRKGAGSHKMRTGSLAYML
jgi:hypothetical protein